MREILFRGKRIDNGKWVYGSLIQRNIWGHIFPVIRAEDNGFDNYKEWEVIPETIGQYTGFDDKNGVKVFDGDVVECTSTWDKANMVVIFEDGEYRLVLCDKYKNYTSGRGYYSIGCFDKKVIGNIHDNTEVTE